VTHKILEYHDWKQQLESHREIAQKWTLPTLKRRSCQQINPVEDFLFTYYPFGLSKLEQWHPGFGIGLRCSKEDVPDYMQRGYSFKNEVLFADASLMNEKEMQRLLWMLELLKNTSARAGNFGCFGMHEWAMVYQVDKVRHDNVAPLRLSKKEIAEFVKSRPIHCSHFDAYRFFTKQAAPLNQLNPTLEKRHEMEQPGCVHANMDLYKWVQKSSPWINGELLLGTFRLALELRALDMKASPYDLSAFHYDPIKIETIEGRKIYETEQRRLAEKAVLLRQQLIVFLEATISLTNKETLTR
jgi:hypothetical protein